MKKYADNNLEFDENGRMFSKWFAHTVGKGEIARYEQFLLFLQCFQKTSAFDINFFGSHTVGPVAARCCWP